MKQSQSGFTMVEVMVAILLTAIAILGIIGLYLSETRASSYSRHTTEATTICEDKLEVLRTQAPPASSAAAEVVNDQGVITTGAMFSRTWVVTAVGTAYYDLSCTVTWDEDGLARTLTLRGRRNQ